MAHPAQLLSTARAVLVTAIGTGARRRSIALALVCGLALLVTGCAGASNAGAWLGLLVALLMAACANRPATPDAGAGREGHCEPCCGYAPDPVHGCCWCPARTICNYGIGCFNDASHDGGPPIHDEPCCLVDDAGLLGSVATCLCPAHTACGFAFVDCGDGRCSVAGGPVCPPDAGIADAESIDGGP